MKSILLGLLLLLGLMAWTCMKHDTSTNAVEAPRGSFSYTGFDSLGTAIVQGWFTLLIADSDHVSGEWHFRKTGLGNEIGPQIGDGNLVGGFFSGQLWVELNPQFRDNNLQLRGTYSTTHYTGTWQAIGIGGPYNHGSFNAKAN